MIVTVNPLDDTDLHHGSQSGESSPIHRGIPHPATHITSSRSCGCTPAQLASLEEAWTSPIRTHTRPIADRDLFFADWTAIVKHSQSSQSCEMRAGEITCTTENALTTGLLLSLIHISEPTRLGMISYAVF